jgi:nucleoside-diphosphate-sugar epimerase
MVNSILITGIHGFVGSNLVNTYKSQYSIYGLDIISPPEEGIVATYAWNELNQIPDVDIIIHLAGKAHDTINTTEEQVYIDINYGLTKKIYDWFLKSNAKIFVFFSSVKAAADTVMGDILTEDVLPLPKGPYGESKIKAENYILDELKKWRDTSTHFDGAQCETLSVTADKKVYILRPCMIHGPGNKGNLNLLYKMVSKGIPWPLGAFHNQRSFCSIDNIVMVLQELIQGDDIPAGIYNVCDDEALSTNDIIRLIAQSKNINARIWKLPKALIKTAAYFGDILRLPLNTERLKKLTENYQVSNAKIKNAIGIKKMPVSASEGLVKTLKSFRRKD